jgi:lysophospholipid acyltransferase (LPLAT)-like uncharacterized protein
VTFWLVRFLGVFCMRLFVGSCRTRIIGWDEWVETEHARGSAVLFAFWHNRLLIPAWFFRGRNIHVLVSRHPDAELMARIVERIGFVAVRGSAERSPGKSKKGGVRALHTLARRGREGYDLAFTPDGPRGPLYSIAPGLLALSRLTRLKVVPLGVEMARFWRLGSWDRFRIPKPFTKTVCFFGPPLELSRDPARAHAQLAEAMKEVSHQAAELVGRKDPFDDAGDAVVGALKE